MVHFFFIDKILILLSFFRRELAYRMIGREYQYQLKKTLPF